MAAGIGPSSRHLHRIPVSHEPLGDRPVTDELGEAHPVLAEDFEPAAEQLLAQPLADAHRKVGRRLQSMDGFEDQERDPTGEILPVGIGPTQLDVGCLAQQQAGQVEDRFVVGQEAGR